MVLHVCVGVRFTSSTQHEHGKALGTLRGVSSRNSHKYMRVFNVGLDAKDELDTSDELKLQDVLCSEKVVSRLHPCPKEDGFGPMVMHRYHGHIYPFTADYQKAVDEKHACPLPAPFMRLSKIGFLCCVDRSNKHIWPNFCPGVDDIIGSRDINDESLVWNMAEANHEPALPPGVYQVGLPEIPQNYAKYSMSIAMIFMYFALGLACLSLYVFVYRRLEEEMTISKGKEHEEVFLKTQEGKRLTTAEFVDDSEEEGLSSDEEDLLMSDQEAESTVSLSPAHSQMARGTAEESVDQVAMSFGLLPGLPRGRSANSSNLTTPLMTARGGAAASAGGLPRVAEGGDRPPPSS